ncbi:MAG: hypothetical protein OXQ92_11640 [Boseongicola sp.]|nr:hypothetical protein [Boseongicola sp.]MDD9977904.1 hypothetical protein [Boseongicola sp.]
MTTLINTTKNAVSNVVLFAASALMAGLGIAVIATLAVFAFFAMGIALIAAPFVGLAMQTTDAPEKAEFAA